MLPTVGCRKDAQGPSIGPALNLYIFDCSAAQIERKCDSKGLVAPGRTVLSPLGLNYRLTSICGAPPSRTRHLECRCDPAPSTS
eukprot:scaffold661210_cov52-Prasinocladus_malaysianus.AAC.1